ncbi:ergothioneine biosynthesis protein EgtB [uncultured Microscilla sp.]|uniref:ergothioneine biosynthesis protein EgtB n=1 Tax=uncultured Microscilla sp. TaxID=432653 RepID=UPI0026110A7B|nr:ergothioneine biosynthesis protein EgtB [uncultured Microscilla sp.]
MKKTSTLGKQYHTTRQTTLDLCAPLSPEDYVVQPIEDVSPPKWHLGHTTWFFENFILANEPDYQLFNADFNYFFNSYYESQGERVLRTNRGNMTRPTIDEIKAYRQHVDEHMEQFFVKYTEVPQDLFYVIDVGIQHEKQHQELLVTDLKYILGGNPLFPVYQPNGTHHSTPFAKTESYLPVKEGLYSIGYEGEGFHYDNETGKHQVFLHAYQVMDRLITNEEYLEFIASGGYENFEHWLADGWDWVNKNGIKAPYYWFEQNGEWFNYTLHGFNKVDPHAPVTHVSFYEADAFAKWKGKRLPTEFEWEVACNQYVPKVPENANLLEGGHFVPLSRTNNEYQMFGEVWEWTNSAYLPYPYYQKAEGGLGEYNGKFMVNQMVLRGGSCATPKDQIRSSYRNFFQADKRWQFTGIRLAESL